MESINEPGESAQYTANTGMNTISTANTGLDGGGTLKTILTATSNGTFIKSVIIKAQAAVAGGMVRLFIFDGVNTRLLEEILVYPTAGGSSSLYHTYSQVVPLNFYLKSGYLLKAATDKAQTYNVIAEGIDWVYP